MNGRRLILVLSGLLTATTIVSAGSTASDAAKSTFYCPWADMVLRIKIDRQANSVTIDSGAAVPTPGTYDAQILPSKIGAADVEEIRFQITDQSYWYAFVLRLWGADLVTLENKRTKRSTGKARKQSGYCFVENE